MIIDFGGLRLQCCTALVAQRADAEPDSGRAEGSTTLTHPLAHPIFLASVYPDSPPQFQAVHPSHSSGLLGGVSAQIHPPSTAMTTSSDPPAKSEDILNEKVWSGQTGAPVCGIDFGNSYCATIPPKYPFLFRTLLADAR